MRSHLTKKYHYTRDHLGSIRRVVNEQGQLVARYSYSLYGEQTVEQAWAEDGVTKKLDFGYTGHYTHAATGLVLAPYRAYDAELGRWISEDPIGVAGGLNLYGYVGNDVVNFWDPTGRQSQATVSAIQSNSSINAAHALSGYNRASHDKQFTTPPSGLDAHGEASYRYGEAMGLRDIGKLNAQTADPLMKHNEKKAEENKPCPQSSNGYLNLTIGAGFGLGTSASLYYDMTTGRFHGGFGLGLATPGLSASLMMGGGHPSSGTSLSGGFGYGASVGSGGSFETGFTTPGGSWMHTSVTK